MGNKAAILLALASAMAKTVNLPSFKADTKTDIKAIEKSRNKNRNKKRK